MPDAPMNPEDDLTQRLERAYQQRNRLLMELRETHLALEQIARGKLWTARDAVRDEYERLTALLKEIDP